MRPTPSPHIGSSPALLLLALLLSAALMFLAASNPASVAAQTPDDTPTPTPPLTWDETTPDGTVDFVDSIDAFGHKFEAVEPSKTLTAVVASPEISPDRQFTATEANLTWTFPDDMPESTRSAYRALFADIESFSERRFNRSVEGLVINVVVGYSSEYCGRVRRHGDGLFTMWLNPGCVDDSGLPREVMAHEYFHVLQHLPTPGWIREGTAEYFAFLYLDDAGIRTYASSRNSQIEFVRTRQFVPLRYLLRETIGSYSLAFLAVDYLAQQVGRDAPIDYFDPRKLTSDDWESEFNRFFRVSVETFYQNFEAYRAANGFPSVLPPPHAGDRAILVTLYNATDGPNWTDNTHWLSDRNLIEWDGVVIDERGRVTRLRLGVNELSGEIPAELGRLTNLERLELIDNDLISTIPPELGNLSNLTYLSLGSNELSGEIPIELSRLTNLESLSLGSNQLTGEIPAELGRLTNLELLSLGDNQLTGEIPPELGNLSNLEWLNLNGNELSGEIPAGLGRLTNLESLSLGRNQLTRIPPELGNLSNLTSLALAGNKLTGAIPSELGNLTNLRWLRLHQNQLTGEIPPELGNLSNLTSLALENNQLSGAIPSELGNLANLEHLALGNNRFTGCIPANLRDIAQYGRDNSLALTLGLPFCRDELAGYNCASDCQTLLSIKDTLIDSENALNWGPGYPIYEWTGLGTDDAERVTRLNLGGIGLSGRIPPELGNLSNLEWLNLSGNELSGEIPAELGRLTNLESLSLGPNKLTGEIPPELGNLSNLTNLWLAGNELTGAIPSELGNLTNLRWLGLHQNHLTGEIPPELGNLSNLTILALENNQLSGAIPSELGNLANLEHLALGNNRFTGCIPDNLRDIAQYGPDIDLALTLGLSFCDGEATPTPEPTATSEPTPTPEPTATQEPTSSPTPTATPVAAQPTATPSPTPLQIPEEVLNRLSALETLVATLQSLISTLESSISTLTDRIAALESDASSPTPTPTPAPVVPTPTPAPIADDPCIGEFTDSGSKDGRWSAECESVTSSRLIIDTGRGSGPHYALYYTFTLDSPADVTVTLDSDEDTFLYLLAGKGANVAALGALDVQRHNDDHGSPVETDACANDGDLEQYDSCITTSLAPGDYTIETTTYSSGATGAFTVTLTK